MLNNKLIFKMKILIIVALVFALASAKTINKFQHDFQERVKDITDSATIYAVLVAGSNTWSNYRHQVKLPTIIVNSFVMIFFFYYSGRRQSRLSNFEKQWSAPGKHHYHDV